MAQNFKSAENQASCLIGFNSQSAGSVFKVLDSDGKELMSFTSPKSYVCAVISSPDIQKGKSYSITVDGKDVADFTVSDSVYNSGVSGGMGGGMGGKGGPGNDMRGGGDFNFPAGDSEEGEQSGGNMPKGNFSGDAITSATPNGDDSSGGRPQRPDGDSGSARGDKGTRPDMGGSFENGNRPMPKGNRTNQNNEA